MNFGAALEALEKGQKVSREGWNGKQVNMTMFLYLTAKVDGLVNNPIKAYCELNNINVIAMNNHIDMFIDCGDGKPLNVIGWAASQTDLFAKDWYIVEEVTI